MFCGHKSRSVVKCFQCSSVVDLARQPFGPKETRVRLELSSACCYRFSSFFVQSVLFFRSDFVFSFEGIRFFKGVSCFSEEF